MSLTVTAGVASRSGALVTGSTPPTGSGPAGVVVSDFNGDGVYDLATANSNDNTVTVLLGNGSGGFTAAPGSPFSTGASPSAIVTGDFNNDGRLDLAIANNAGNSVTVLLGNGSGGFSAAPGSPFATGAFPIGLTLGDFNGDQKLDIAVANSGDNTLTVLLGTGTGSFTAQTQGVLTVSATPHSIASADFNGDGYRDIVIASATSTTGVATVLLGSAAGFVQAPNSPFALPSRGLGVTIGDWNNDLTPDLAFAGVGGSNAIAIYTGVGGGRFTAGSSVSVGTAGTALTAITSGDVDGDTNNDIVVTSASGAVYVLLGNGSAAFGLAAGGALSAANASWVQVADLNGDNKTDMVIANARTPGSLTVLLGAIDPVGLILVSNAGSTVATGANVTFTASLVISAVYPLRAPTGSIAFSDPPASLGTVGLAGSAATLTTSFAAGSHAVTASYGGDGSTTGAASNTVSFTVADPANITAYSGTPQTVNANSQFAPLQVIVKTAGGTALSGVTVTFTAPSSGASGTFVSSPSVVTNNQGIAIAPTFTANSLAGSFVVTASANGGSISTTFSLTNVVPVALRFVSVTPCRVADTRNPAGPFGAPYIAGQATRTFIIPNGPCNIPATAQAYSVNATVVPQGPLGYLTLWPTGASQPTVSTLNSSDGRIRSNAAIVPAGTGGGMNVFASNSTDFVLDIDGYFVRRQPLARCRSIR